MGQDYKDNRIVDGQAQQYAALSETDMAKKVDKPQSANDNGYEYDIFICYRHDIGRGSRYKNIGCAVARALAQALKRNGYKVYFDCDEKPYPKFVGLTISAMRESKLVIIMLSAYSFRGLKEEDGFAEELKTAKLIHEQDMSIYRDKEQAKQKGRIVIMNVNGQYSEEMKKKLRGTVYEWLEDICYCSYQTDRRFVNDFDGELVPRIKNTIEKPSGGTTDEIIRSLREQHEKDKRFQKRWMAVLLIAIVAIVASWLFMDRLSFAGGGTAKNYVTDKLHVRIDPKSYWPTPSGSAAIHLSEYAKSKNGGINLLGCNIPAVLSAEPFTASTFNGDTSSFEGTVHLLELLIGYADMQVLVYPCDSKQCDSTITVSQLVKLLLDKNTIIATTSSSSGTYKKYKDVLSVSCNLDSVQEQKKTR